MKKIVYVTTYDSSDIHTWSGTGCYMLTALQNSGIKFERIGNLKEGNIWALLSRLKRIYYFIARSRYMHDREPKILKNYATQVKKSLAFVNPDIVFSPGSSPIAYLQTEKPIVFWTDATFAGMIDFYPGYSNLCAETIKNGNKMEQLALSKCRLAIYASEWAASTAIQYYDVDPKKVKVVPFGANIDCNRNIKDIELITDNKQFDVCRLLFVGIDWQRKGGDVAFNVAEKLNKRGINTELHVVGCTPDRDLPNFVKPYGFISKRTEEGRESLNNLMTESHFLIVPSKAECYGVVFAEASSFGLPSIATKVGGIPTVIHDEINGHTFPLDESPDKYCDYIEQLMASKEQYRQLALSSFREYKERLNWSSAGRRVHELIEEYCS